MIYGKVDFIKAVSFKMLLAQLYFTDLYVSVNEVRLAALETIRLT
jgi:hypothetical protein